MDSAISSKRTVIGLLIVAASAVSDTGYFFEVSLGENDDGSPAIVPEGALAPATTYYTQANCAGTGYLAIPFGDWRFMWRQGFVVAASSRVHVSGLISRCFKWKNK